MKHKLQVEKHQFFLDQNRKDPITGDVIQANDTVVICAVCKSAFLIDSWEYMNNQHCNQTSTLKKIPREELVLFKREKINTEPIIDTTQSIIRNEPNRGCLLVVVMIVLAPAFIISMLTGERTGSDILIVTVFFIIILCAIFLPTNDE